jgi:phospholipid-binding lipoprotein MlaA
MRAGGQGRVVGRGRARPASARREAANRGRAPRHRSGDAMPAHRFAHRAALVALAVLLLAPGTGRAADDYDPWAPFNERMFVFNHDVLDRFVVRPAATAWDAVVPDPVQRALGRAFDNLEMPRRLVNNLLQARPVAAGGEVARFVVNTTVGVAGLIDVAEMIHLEQQDADMGQTLGVWGLGPGPYLVLPFMPPLTVRDGVGRGVDSALDPLGYVLPFVAGTVMGIVHDVNERSLNLELFADVEAGSLDLYTAVRNGYLQRRDRSVAARRAESPWVLLARAPEGGDA